MGPYKMDLAPLFSFLVFYEPLSPTNRSVPTGPLSPFRRRLLRLTLLATTAVVSRRDPRFPNMRKQQLVLLGMRFCFQPSQQTSFRSPEVWSLPGRDMFA